MLQRLLGEDLVPIQSTTVQGRGEEEQQELLEPREQEGGPDILQAQE